MENEDALEVEPQGGTRTHRTDTVIGPWTSWTDKSDRVKNNDRPYKLRSYSLEMLKVIPCQNAELIEGKELKF